MDLSDHAAIEGKLEASKAAGWLSEYLVAWHGPTGELTPNVIVWRVPERNDGAVMAHVRCALTGLVSSRNIVVAGV